MKYSCISPPHSGDTGQVYKKSYQLALTIGEQIENLKLIGLIINDEASAAAFLNDVSYYRFIKAYSLGLKPRNGYYYRNITFERLKDLYLFDAGFRHLMFPQIEKIEINLRCRLTNYFCLKYGLFGYLDPQNFSTYPQRFKQVIGHSIKRNMRSAFIRNFRQNYETGQIPFYALVEVLSFGTLSKFFKNMKAADKKNLCFSYGIGYSYFESWLENISYVRNVCAHYCRIYNAKFPKTPRLFRQDAKHGIPNNRIMATLMCLKRLLPNDRHWFKFVTDIDLLIKAHPYVRIEALGFPENWKSILLK